MERRRLLLLSAAVALVVGGLGGWWLSTNRDSPDRLVTAGADTLPDEGIPVATDVNGEALPSIEAETLQGDAIDIRSLTGQPLILNFWYSTCLPCRKEMPGFQAVHESVGDRVKMVGVNPLDSSGRAQGFADEVGATYELLRDPDGRVTAGLGVARFPTTLFVAADGTILATKAGELTPEELRARIEELFPLVIDGAFALAFISGVVATVNPCGFAMLPAYLSYFLGLESRAEADEAPQASLTRALMVSASVSAGFLAVFTVLGFVIRAGGDGVADVIRYLSILIGLVLIGVGVAMLLGRKLAFQTPRLDKGGRSRTFWSMFVFGVSYAVASFGCTIGPFVLTILGSFTRDGTLSGVLMIVAYGLGMGLLLTALTVTLALARGGLLRSLRSALRWVDNVAGVLLILAGLYLVYYWWYDLVSDTGARNVAGGGLSDWFQRRADLVAGWLNDRGAGLLALVLGAIAVAAVAAVLARRSSPPGGPAPDQPGSRRSTADVPARPDA